MRETCVGTTQLGFPRCLDYLIRGLGCRNGPLDPRGLWASYRSPRRESCSECSMVSYIFRSTAYRYGHSSNCGECGCRRGHCFTDSDRYGLQAYAPLYRLAPVCDLTECGGVA